MKKTIWALLFILFPILACANIYIFVSGISLGEKINYYERESKTLHGQNIELEKKVYEVNSLQYTASEAARLEFVKKVEPIYIQNLPVALNK